ncbi:N-acetylmuramoyl-L-alanine amidase [Kitasatospora sp. NBC_00070]|uniref:N-acetylmuramoyl-L-alanine amidase n=1 Tax=Kitasatospora sp. NBC_00070 TaxID=2975962 RepID=UPI00324F62CD
MARMPGTTWIGPTPNRTVGGQAARRGLALHIQDGSEAGSEAWFKNPEAQASSHFLNPKVGGLRQMVDTDDKAWAQAAGNPYWISVENEGRGGDALTASQIENCARLLAWLHTTYDVALQLTDDPNGRGLGWHGMGGAAWGGHPDCPGKAVLAQRGQILARAQQLTNPPQEDDVAITTDEINRIAWAVVKAGTPDLPQEIARAVVERPEMVRLTATVAAQSATITTLATQLGQQHDINVDELIARIEAAISNIDVHLTTGKES